MCAYCNCNFLYMLSLQVFRNIDKDGDGQVDVYEFETALDKIGTFIAYYQLLQYNIDTIYIHHIHILYVNTTNNSLYMTLFIQAFL